MTSFTRKVLVILAAPLLAGALSACGDNPVRFQGRLAFSDMSACESPVGDTQQVSWSECNTFKRKFDPATGVAITSDSARPDGLRPLPAMVRLDVYRGGRGERESLLVRCGTSYEAVTDINGIFNIRVGLSEDDPHCQPGSEGLLVIGTVNLQYRMSTADSRRSGTIRAIWQEEQAYPLLADEGFDTEFYTGEWGYSSTSPEGVETRFAVPQLNFIATRVSIPSVASEDEVPVVNLQTRVFLNSAGDDRYGYLRQLLTGYANVVNLHEEARTVIGNTSDYYDKMFVAPPEGTSGWGKTYSVFFDNTWAFGWRGGMALLRPDVERFAEDGNGDGMADGSWGAAWLLSSTGVLGHEFGHSMQGGYARYGLPFDYDFAGKMQRPDGREYDWGHGGWQHAEMGAVMNEGIANSYGQYLLNRCGRWNSSARPIAVTTPFNGGIWSQNRGCDNVDDRNTCDYHHTRWHLRGQRGLSEMGADYGARTTRVSNLITAFIMSGGTRVVSNNELRAGEFGCDLLDNVSDVSHAAAVTTSARYIPDFTYWVHEYLNGSTAATPAARSFGAGAASENVQISLAQLLEAFGNYCTDCETLPGGRAWSSDYNRKRVSINGSMSPQALGRYLEGRGWISRSDLNNVLRTNFMDEAL